MRLETPFLILRQPETFECTLSAVERESSSPEQIQLALHSMSSNQTQNFRGPISGVLRWNRR